MNEEIERALAALVGAPLWAMHRSGDLVSLQLGERRTLAASEESPERGIGQYSLDVACPWRLADDERILVGSGDLFTPADPDAEIETFDWEERGASWLDVRLDELQPELRSGSIVVERIDVDAFGGMRVQLSRGWRLDVFPNSTPTGHVTTEFWRLLRPGEDAPHLVVGTFGINRE